MPENVFVNKDNTACFVCPACNKAKILDISKYDYLKRAYIIKCKCPCGHVYSVKLEKRQYYRKKINVYGKYTKIRFNDKTKRYERQHKGTVLIKSISRTGIRMSRLETKSDLKVGDKLLLEFRIDDAKGTLIKKTASIVWIKHTDIGAEFDKTESFTPSDQAIAFYLLP